jgi:hypothetical protein
MELFVYGTQLPTGSSAVSVLFGLVTLSLRLFLDMFSALASVLCRSCANLIIPIKSSHDHTQGSAIIR